MFDEKRTRSMFGFFVKKTIVCCLAFTGEADEGMVDRARLFRIKMLTEYIERNPDDIEWPVTVEQYCLPLSDFVAREYRRLIGSDHPSMKLMEDLNCEYRYYSPSDGDAKAERDRGLNHLNSRYSMPPLWTRPKRISFFTPPDSLTVLDISGHMRRSLSETA